LPRPGAGYVILSVILNKEGKNPTKFSHHKKLIFDEVMFKLATSKAIELKLNVCLAKICFKCIAVLKYKI
jgi:hypothetical protein